MPWSPHGHQACRASQGTWVSGTAGPCARLRLAPHAGLRVGPSSPQASLRLWRTEQSCGAGLYGQPCTAWARWGSWRGSCLPSCTCTERRQVGLAGRLTRTRLGQGTLEGGAWPGGRCLAVWGGSREPSGSWRAREARSSGQVRSGAFLKSRQMEPGPPAGRGGTACRMGPAEPGVGVLTPRSPAASGGGCAAAAGRAGRRAPGHGAGGKAGPAPSWPRLACQASFPRAPRGCSRNTASKLTSRGSRASGGTPPPAPLPGAGPAASPELGRGLLTPAQGVGPLARCRPGGSSGGPPNRRQQSPPPRGPH